MAITEGGVPPVRLADRPRETVRRPRRENQMDVVRHQAIGPDLHRRLAAALAQEVAIELVVRRLEEHRLAAVAALGHVMREAGTTMRPMRAIRPSCRQQQIRAIGKASP